ncbi:MAG TPA: type II toxin-antitoxin system VapC family toxin [Longimicrobium sp.]|nr:type II toxin-antitoxin system VapC family toxin [Longimicrobium sp.]
MAHVTLLAACVLPGPPDPAVERLRLRIHATRWVAPWIWRSEMRDRLCRAVRDGRLSLPEALEREKKAEAFLTRGEVGVQGRDVLRLAHESGWRAAECEFVCLSRLLGVPLVTLDPALRAAFPADAVAPEAVLA